MYVLQTTVCTLYSSSLNMWWQQKAIHTQTNQHLQIVGLSMYEFLSPLGMKGLRLNLEEKKLLSFLNVCSSC